MVNTRGLGSVLGVVCAFASGCVPGGDDPTYAVHGDALPETAIAGAPVMLFGAPPTVAPVAFAQPAVTLPAFAATDPTVPVRVASVALQITANSENVRADALENGQPDDWRFVAAAAVYLEATLDAGFTRVRVGTVDPGAASLAAGSRTLTFVPDPVDVRAWLVAGGGYRIVFEFDAPSPPDDVVFDGALRVRIG